ncbi:hypothetical protein NMA58_00760 [Rhizobium sp. YTUHZ045]|uniref:hypothetical protein n=1 Tax=Rhizobium sp. YTUHZ045 TaxID=2962888 RepID=UPI003DA8DA01
MRLTSRVAGAQELFKYRRDEGGFQGWLESRLPNIPRRSAYQAIEIFRSLNEEMCASFAHLKPAAIAEVAKAEAGHSGSDRSASKRELYGGCPECYGDKYESLAHLTRKASYALGPAPIETVTDKNLCFFGKSFIRNTWPIHTARAAAASMLPTSRLTGCASATVPISVFPGSSPGTYARGALVVSALTKNGNR